MYHLKYPFRLVKSGKHECPSIGDRPSQELITILENAINLPDFSEKYTELAYSLNKNKDSSEKITNFIFELIDIMIN